MRYSISWFGHGFGFGIWRTRYAHSDIWSVCFGCVSVYISKDKPAGEGT